MIIKRTNFLKQSYKHANTPWYNIILYYGQKYFIFARLRHSNTENGREEENSDRSYKLPVGIYTHYIIIIIVLSRINIQVLMLKYCNIATIIYRNHNCTATMTAQTYRHF